MSLGDLDSKMEARRATVNSRSQVDFRKALSQQLLKEEDLKVKETIASTIGQIGKPDAQVPLCVDALARQFQLCKTSEESQLKCMIVWALLREWCKLDFATCTYV